jgi:hypothetical protein
MKARDGRTGYDPSACKRRASSRITKCCSGRADTQVFRGMVESSPFQVFRVYSAGRRTPLNARSVRRQEARSKLTPTYATHYHDAGRRPLLNLSDLDGSQLNTVLADLNHASSSQDTYRRTYGPRYMDFRRRTEARLRDLFVSRGGDASRSSPHYFVLGDSRWLEGLYPKTASVRLNLEDLPVLPTSITYPDSFVSMALGPEYGLPHEPKPYHEQVFLLDELPEFIRKYGMPEDEENPDYEKYHKRPFEKFVEIQIWSDDPVSRLLTTAPPAA